MRGCHQSGATKYSILSTSKIELTSSDTMWRVPRVGCGDPVGQELVDQLAVYDDALLFAQVLVLAWSDLAGERDTLFRGGNELLAVLLLKSRRELLQVLLILVVDLLGVDRGRPVQRRFDVDR